MHCKNYEGYIKKRLRSSRSRETCTQWRVTGSDVEKVIQKSQKELGGINESYNCLRGDLHDGQVGLRCNHILRHFSW